MKVFRSLYHSFPSEICGRCVNVVSFHFQKPRTIVLSSRIFMRIFKPIRWQNIENYYERETICRYRCTHVNKYSTPHMVWTFFFFFYWQIYQFRCVCVCIVRIIVFVESKFMNRIPFYFCVKTSENPVCWTTSIDLNLHLNINEINIFRLAWKHGYRYVATSQRRMSLDTYYSYDVSL